MNSVTDCDDLQTDLENIYKWADTNNMSTCVADRVRRLATDPVVMRSSPATDIYVAHCWLISLYKLNLLLRLLA